MSTKSRLEVLERRIGVQEHNLTEVDHRSLSWLLDERERRTLLKSRVAKLEAAQKADEVDDEEPAVPPEAVFWAYLEHVEKKLAAEKVMTDRVDKLEAEVARLRAKAAEASFDYYPIFGSSAT